MQPNRDIRIAAAVIVYSILITSAFSFKLQVFNKEKNINEQHDLFKYIEDGKIRMLENSRNCSIAKKAIMVLGLTTHRIRNRQCILSHRNRPEH